MIDISVRVSNYKCFKHISGGFDCIKPINLIIGRNNTGKSSLLDLIEHLCKNPPDKFSAGSKIEFIQSLKQEDLLHAFPNNTSGGALGGKHWRDHGQHFVNKQIHFEVDSYFNNAELKGFIDFDHITNNPLIDSERKSKLESVALTKSKILRDKHFRRLLADRDIVLEPKSKELKLNANGLGATNIIQRYITHSEYDRDVIQANLLNALNEIFEPDAFFTEIQVQMYDGVMYSGAWGLNQLAEGADNKEDTPDNWEIFLGEKTKGLIALSKSGSGLKTIILVLLNLLVIPKLDEDKELSNYIFAFEELENNLHPSLLRRLQKFLMDFAIESGCHIFLTTHSNVAIDQFASNENSQIIHVRHDGTQATTETINCHIGRSELLDDLGTKASDLLQANGLIWLEGPSDRIYFNRWIEIFTNDDLKEGRDYECVFYGGSNLASFDAKDPVVDEDYKDKINLLSINRNAILIGDSDKTSKNMKLKGRVATIKPEMEKLGAHVWITKAKEVENYLPVDALRIHYDKDELPQLEIYQQFSYDPSSKTRASAKAKPKGYLQKYRIQKSEKYDKVKLARNIIPHFTKENLTECFELAEQMETIIERIKKWNQF